MWNRRTLLKTAAAAALIPAARAGAAEMPGVTASEIRIGNTNPHSGPASAYGAIANAEVAFFKMLNEQGGVGGRKVNYITLDDAYSPPKTVEQTRKLVEQDGVAFIFNGLGTPCQTAVRQYMNAHKVPQLFVATGADKWADPTRFPWTMGWQPSYRTEATIYAKYILKEMPNARIAVLYQNDDFGKDYLIGLKDGLGDAYGKMVVKEVSYETTDPTIDSQAVTLQASGADVLVTGATPKWAAQTIRKIAELNWKPLHFMTNVSISVGSVLKPAGLENARGLITAAYGKDPTDKRWDDDAGMKEWRAFMAKYMPGAELTDINHVYGYGVSLTLVQVLKQCGDDLSRANVMKQAANLHDLELPTLLPGIKVGTSPTEFHPIRSMQLSRWTGTTWDLFGEVITA
ncbi:MAG: ABC transporter substrate-binding protein [Rhodospirillales bacterium]|nr:ABC transporter substrate-binding protein [Rhodospirillales bacterium]